ncbi:MAG: hypothetical protein FWE27_01140 [Defluviitaleaceae bacterium]|nr:hypothetical protein [Defluviitaleaceae bacterium]
MQINSLGGISVYNPNARTNTANQMKSVQLPGFGWGKGLMPTHTTTNRSDCEIRSAIVELAKQDARNGIDGSNLDTTLRSTKPSEEYQKLMGEFVQSVSPDRSSIFPAALTQLGTATKLQNGKPLIDNSLLELMLNGTKVTVKNPGIQYDSKSKMMEIHHFMITAGGEDIGSYSITYGWGYSWTNEEQARNIESSQLYRDTWLAERAKIKE